MRTHQVIDIKKGWQNSDVAENYEGLRFRSFSGRLSDWLDQRAIKRALKDVDKGARILDMPCGTGRMLRFLDKDGYSNLVGVDISTEMLDVARRGMQGKASVEFQNKDAQNTGFENDSLDVIFSLRFMGHIPRETRVLILSEMRRICSGKIIVEFSIKNRIAGVSKRILRPFRPSRKLPQQWKWHVLTQSEVAEEAREARLRISNRYWKLPFFSESVLVEMKQR